MKAVKAYLRSGASMAASRALATLRALGKGAAIVGRHADEVICIGGILAVGVGAALQFGLPYGLIAGGGLLFLDFHLPAVR